MEDMSRIDENKKIAISIAEFLNSQKAEHVMALDISERSSWADVFVIATVNSQGQMNGLIRLVDEFVKENDLQIKTPLRKMDSSEWVLIDCSDIVIHLMDKKSREFYELERLWFDAAILYESPEQI